MTKKETLSILAVLDTAYRGRFSKGDANITLDIWYNCFKNTDYDDVYTAVMHFINNDLTGYAPIPGQIHETVDFLRRRRDTENIQEHFDRQYINDYDYDTGKEGVNL